MKKTILFNLSLFFAIGLSAQSFQLMDHNDVNIGGTESNPPTHYEYGDAAELGLTKFHVKNLTGTTKNFAVKVTLEYVPYSLSDLAVCFGTACYSASASVSSTQIINGGVGEDLAGGASFVDLKIAPVTWPWVAPATDSCVWVVTIFDSANPSDGQTARVIWRDNSTFTSVNEIDVDNIKLNTYPNPASNNVTIDYSISKNGSLIMHDLVGKEVARYSLVKNANKLNINVNNLKSGVYFYSVMIDNKVLKTERLIVK
ncbi:MAG: T9SS type A sorting domain-containing protein [Flavobacteriales bacterium]|nr:T9SS type A sorting domain-containing protein [Flavobacteriales bacterium]